MKNPRRRSARSSMRNAVNIPLETGRSRSASNDNTPSRKRKRNTSSSIERTRAHKRIVDGRIIDQYCWVCHKFGSESICNSCPRVYHKDCLRKLKGNGNLALLCECYLTRVDGKDEDLDVTKERLHALLQFLTIEAVQGKNHKQRSRKTEHNRFVELFGAWPAEHYTLCRIMDLTVLADRLNNDKAYSSTGQFFLDVKWLYHNCCIIYGPDNEITETALNLEKNFKLELIDLEACTGCYQNRSLEHGFTQVCENNHEVVWAKLRGSPYWPAKLLNQHNGLADVRFFGTHDKANIQLKHCFKLSKEPPLRRIILQPKYMEAVEERNIYIKNYEFKTRRNLEYCKVNTPLDAGNAHAKKGRKGRHRLHRMEKVLRNEGSSCSSGSGAPKDTCEYPNDKEVKCVRNFLDKGGSQDMAESVEGIDSTDSSVVYRQLTFIADEHNGPASDNNTDEFNCALPQASCDPDLYSTTGFLPSSNNFETGTEAEENPFQNMFNTVCVMTPDVSPIDIPGVPVLSSNTVSADLGNLPVITSTSGTDPHTDNSVAQAQACLQQLKDNYAQGDDDHDDIEFLNEERETSPVKHFLKHPSMLKAISQVLLGTKPRIKEQLRKFNNLLMHTFLSMWVEMFTSRFESNDLKNFLEVSSKFINTIKSLKEQNSKLEKELKELKSELDTTKASLVNFRKTSERPALKDIAERIADQKIKTEVAAIKEKHRTSLQEKNKEIELLKIKLQTAEEYIELKEVKIKGLRQVSSQHEELLQNSEKFVQHKSTQTEETENPQSKDASVDIEDDDSDQFIGNDLESGNELSSDSEGLQSFTHINVQQREVVIMQTNMPSLPVNSALNLSGVQQPYEHSFLMPDCGMLITPQTAEMMAIAPMAVVTPVVQGPSLLGVDSSSNYLHSGSTTESNSNQSKTSSGKRRKTNT